MKSSYGPMKDNIRRVFGGPETYEIVLARPADPVTHKRKSYSKRIVGNLKAAKALKAEMTVELSDDKKSGISKSSLTVGDVLQRYLRESKPYRAHKTYQSLEQIINGRLMPSFAHIKLDELTYEIIQTESVRWSKEGKLQPLRGKESADLKCGISAASVNRHLVILSMIMKKCIAPWNLLRDNPVSHVERLTALPTARKTYSWAEVKQLLHTASLPGPRTSDLSQQRTQAIVHLALFTGMRRGELFGLSWKDIDFHENELYVHQVIEYTEEHGLLIKPVPKTVSSIRYICFDKYTREILKSLKAEYNETKLKLGGNFDKHDYQLVFSDITGEPLRPENFSITWRRLTAKAGIKHISIHDLRHTHATLCGDLGIEMESIRDRLGHSKGSITGHYRHRSRTADQALQGRFSQAYQENVLAS